MPSPRSGIEIFTVDLTFGLIAVGAGAAALTAAAGAPLWVQGVVGVGVSLAGIAFVRPVALRHLKQRHPADPHGRRCAAGGQRQWR